MHHARRCAQHFSTGMPVYAPDWCQWHDNGGRRKKYRNVSQLQGLLPIHHEQFYWKRIIGNKSGELISPAEDLRSAGH